MDCHGCAATAMARTAVAICRLALRYGTVTRTLARDCPLVINLSVAGAPAVLDVEALLATDPMEEQT